MAGRGCESDHTRGSPRAPTVRPYPDIARAVRTPTAGGRSRRSHRPTPLDESRSRPTRLDESHFRPGEAGPRAPAEAPAGGSGRGDAGARGGEPGEVGDAEGLRTGQRGDP